MFQSNIGNDQLPDLYNPFIVTSSELVREHRVPANAVHIAIMQSNMQLVDKASLRHFRQKMHFVVSSSDQHANLVPIDRIERIGVVSSVQQKLVRFLAVSDVVYIEKRVSSLPCTSFQ